MADAASRLTHLPDRKFFSYFCTHFPQSKTWSLPHLASMFRLQITTMLHNKKSPKDFMLSSSGKTPPPGANGIAHDLKCIEDPINFLQIYDKCVYARLLFLQEQPTKKRLVKQ